MSSARNSSRPPAGSGRSGTKPTGRSSRRTATGSCPGRPSGTRAGGRRSSTPSTWRCASGSGWSTLRRSRSSTSPGPARCGYLQALVVSQVDVPVGRVIYTPLLNAAGGIFADLTIIRLGHDHFRVVTGGGMGMRDKKWFVDHLPADGSAQLTDLTSALYTVGVWGPRARDLVQSRRGRRPVQRGVPVRDGRRPSRSTASARWCRGSPTSASSAGRSTARWSRGSGCGTRSGRRAGRSASPPVGIGVYATTGRLEKGYRAHGAELELEYDLVEAGMARPTVKDAEFVGKAAYLDQRIAAAGRGPLHADRRRSHLDERRQALHARPGADPRPRRRAARRREGPPLVRDERRVRAVGRQAPPDDLPPAGAAKSRARSSSSSTSASGTRSPWPWPAARPLFDPTNERIRS